MSRLAARCMNVFLSVAIVILMLGFPATLLNPLVQTDSFSAPLLEGLTLPQPFGGHHESTNTRELRPVSFSPERPIFTTSLLRPPIQ